MRPQDVALLDVGGLADALDDLEADVFALFVAIKPEDEVVGAFSLRSQKVWHLQLRGRLLLLGLANEELCRIRFLPVVEL